MQIVNMVLEDQAEPLASIDTMMAPSVYDVVPNWQDFRVSVLEDSKGAPPTTLPLPESGEPLYRRLAAAVEEMIRRGCLRVGDRMPSLRSLSQRYGVSVPTVTQAYVLLETRGIVEARTRSGFYLRGGRSPSQWKEEQKKCTDSFMVALMRDAARPDFVPFGLYAPSSQFLPSLKLSRALGTVARRSGPKSLEYDLIPGNFSLRQQIAKRSVEWGCALGPDDLIITNGGIEALALCIRAICNPGDTLAVEAPMCPVVVLMLREMGVHALEIECRAPNGLVISELARLLSTRRVQGLLVTPNFNNPSGALMSDRDKKALVELCAFYNVPIIEDDIHGDLGFESKRPMCLKALDRKDSVMLCGSFSRTLAPSYRVGYVVPGKFYRDVIDRKAISTLSNATLPSMAVAEFLANGGYEYHLRTLRRTLAELTSITAEAILKYFPVGTKLLPPRGGSVLWVELPQEVDSYTLFQNARQEKICIIPGNAFSISHNYKNFIRIACGHPWSDVQASALIRLGSMIEHLCRKKK